MKLGSVVVNAGCKMKLGSVVVNAGCKMKLGSVGDVGKCSWRIRYNCASKHVMQKVNLVTRFRKIRFFDWDETD